ncbi:MAG: restriction endonuclease subunit S, partial [Capnocytophaga granulosa]
IAGTIGEVGIIPNDLDGMNLTENAAKLTEIKISRLFLMYCLSSNFCRQQFFSGFHQVAQPKLSLETANKTQLPLPPLAEQHRIAQKVEQLLAIVDTIEQLQEQLKSDVKQAKNQVLSDAIAGKLTHQDPNDEPAEALLKRIGKTTATDTPYEKLPKGWAWCRLGDIGEIIGGGTPSTSIEEYWNGEISWITPADLSNYSDKYIAQGKRNITQLGLDNSSAKLIPKGSILFSTRAPIGYVVIADRPLSTNQGFKSLSLSINMSEEFVYYFLLAEKERIKLLASGTTFQELSASAFSKILIPLPPLAEQHRIVQQIKNYFTAFDQIEKELA